jgi:LytS/YehU family sensor histidine kinase
VARRAIGIGQAIGAHREAQLTTELRDAQLRALVGQLNPHFLFNALNTISAVMYTDLALTDRLLADLGQLLRAGLASDAGPTWSLADERVHTEHFLAAMLARFGDRLSVAWRVDDQAAVAQLPRFTLQLLVELDVADVARVDALLHGDAIAELADGSSVVVSRTHRDTFFARWRGG